jgi:antitoxin MazE
MTAIQLRAELFREMNPLLDSEVAMEKMLVYVRSLVLTSGASSDTTARQGWAAAAKQAHLDGQDHLMGDDIFEDDKLEDW